MSTEESVPRPTPPVLFLFLDIPFGAAVGYLMIAVPFWLRRDGVPLETIAALSTSGFAPHAVKLFWIPVLDIVGTRKGWYLAMMLATAGLLLAASLVPDPAHHLKLFGLLVMLAQATATTGHAANNALMASTVRPEDKGKAAGFAMASNLGSAGLLGALALMVSSRFSPAAGGAVLAAISVGAALASLRIHEQVRPMASAAASVVVRVAHHLRDMAADLWATVNSRSGFTGLLICFAPVGAGAMTNLFAAIAVDYAASSHVVEVVNGIGGGLMSALGSLVGGFLADRMNRRLAYALAGGATALAAVGMMLAPLDPRSYAIGTLTYFFFTGVAFATWAGMVLELVGEGAATATKYGLFNAAANLATTYMTWLDGRGAKLALGRITGPRGMLAVDAGMTFVGVAVLLAMVVVVRTRGPRNPEPAAG